MKRLVMCLALTATPALAGEIEVTLATPASISLSAWCPFNQSCDQDVADQAQAYCQQRKGNAQLAGDRRLVERGIIKGEKSVYRFNCVK
jgi:hypothetical protein